MRKVLFLLVMLAVTALTNAQTLVFHENFDPPSNADSVTASGTANFTVNTRLYTSSPQSDSLEVPMNGLCYLTSQPFSTMGSSNVMLQFSHICKIEIFDTAKIEVSVDGGATWVRLTTQYINPGDANWNTQGFRFSANTYSTLWVPGTPTLKPQQSWWRNEVFDISVLAGNKPDVRVRFVLKDGDGDGASQNMGWYLDDVKVSGAISELFPPKLTMKTPIIQDTVFNTGPFAIYAYIRDASGIDTAYLQYQLNGGANQYIPMLWVSDSTYLGTIPSYSYNNRIDYKVYAFDNSLSHNSATSASYWFYTKKVLSITLGTGTSASYSYGPIYRSSASSSYDYSRYYYLLTAAELTAAGLPAGANISRLEWYKTDAYATSGNASFKIYMKNSALTALTSGSTWATLITGATQVLNSTTQTIPATIGWLPFNHSAFTYTGQALEIGTDWDISAVAGNPSTGAFNFQYTSGLPAIYTIGVGSSTLPTSLTTTYGGTLRPNLRIYYTTISTHNDAGVKQILSPTGSVVAGVNNPVNLTIKNFAVDTLKKATVAWTVDGVLQTPAAWTGSLLEDMISSSFFIGNVNVTPGSHVIKAWTELPNDSLDQNHNNDTATISFYACSALLSGEYTVGGVGADYETFADVMTALNNCGVGGPTVFKINSGTYTGQLTFNPINGASTTNTVTFMPNTGATVIITSASTTSTIKLNGTDYIIFDGSNNGTTTRDMTITNTSTASGTAAIWMASAGAGQGCKKNVVKNCIINAGANTSGIYGIILGGATIGATGADNDSILIQNNSISKAYVGIWAQGSTTSNPGILDNLQIIGNSVGSSTVANYLGHDGIIVANCTGSNIQGNTIFNIITTNTTPVGLTISTGFVSSSITKNKINNIVYTSTGGYGARGMYVNTGNATSDLLIANNFVSTIGGDGYTGFSNSSPAGMYFDGTTGGLNIYYNSVYMNGNLTYSGATLTTAILFYSTSNTAINLKNNVFKNDMNNTANASAKNYAIYSTAPATSFISINNNDYYVSGTQGVLGYLGTDQATLAAWKTATGQDVNSINADPIFTSTTDLHTFASSINNIGTPITGVTDDIDGETRDVVNPDMGADEFTPLANDLGILSVVSPVSGCGLGAAENVTIRLKNLGNTVITTADLYYVLNGGTPVHEVLSGNIASDSTFNYTFTQTADLAATLNYTFKFYVALSGDANQLNDTISNYVVSNGWDLYSSAYTMGFETTDDMSAWTKLDVNGDGYTWIFPYNTTYSHTGSNCAELYNNSSVVADEWLFSRCFTMTAGATYKIEFWYRVESASYPQNIDLKVGNSATPAAMTTNLLALAGFTNTTYQKASVTFVPTTTGTYYFGWWGHSPAAYWYAYIDDINLSIVPDQEAAMLSLTAPVSGCGLSSSEPVTVKIKNTGSGTINGSLTASYKINNASPVTEPVSGSILPGDTLTYTFSTPANLAVTTHDSTFAFKVWINLTGDPIITNDSLAKSVVSFHIPAAPTVIGDTVPYGAIATLHAFSPDSLFWYNVPSGGSILSQGNTFVTPNLYTTSVYYVEARTGSPDLKITEVTHYSTGTGATVSYPTWCTGADLVEITNLGSASVDLQNYTMNIYGVGARSYTIPSVSLGAGEILVLHAGTGTDDPANKYFNMGGGNDVLQSSSLSGFALKDPSNVVIDAVASNGYTFLPVDGVSASDWTGNINGMSGYAGSIRTVSDNNAATDWVISSASTPQTIGSLNPTLTAGASGGGCASIRVPDTAFVELMPFESSVVSMPSPVDQCSNGSENVTIRIRNNGSDTINGNFTAKYSVNGSAPVVEPITSSILPGDTLTFTFATPFLTGLSSANIDSVYNIQAYTELTGDNYYTNDTIYKEVTLNYIPVPPVVANISITYGTTGTLNATAVDSVYWYNVPTGGSELGIGSSFTTPVLYGTTVYYAATQTAGMGILDTTVMPAQSSTYTGNTRGYWFTAPCDFIITGVNVPVSGTTQNVAVVRFTGATPPPEYSSGTTNAFTTLFLAQGNASTGAIPCSVQIFAGDVIGVLGTRDASGVNSYAASGSTVINGFTVAIDRLGMQYNLATTAPQELWQEAGGSISRVELIYQAGTAGGCESARIPDTVFVTGVPACDVSAEAIITPNSALELTNAELVKIRVKNYGTNPATNIPVHYVINGGTPVSEIIAGPIATNDTLLYTFTQAADLSAFGTYNFTVYTDLSCDATLTNDTAHKTVVNSPAVYCNSIADNTGDEEIFSVTVNGATNAYDCSMVAPGPGSVLNEYSNFTTLAPLTTVIQGATVSFTILEDECDGATYYSNGCAIWIDYNRDADFTDPGEQVYVESTTTQGPRTITGTFTVPVGTHVGITAMRIIVAEGYSGASLQPCMSYSYGETEDYNIRILPQIPHDAGVTAFVQPTTPQNEGASVPVQVTVKNFGTDTIFNSSNMTVAYSYAGGAPQSVIWGGGNIAPLATGSVTLPNITVLPNAQSLCAWTVLAGDSNTFNDTTCMTLQGTPQIDAGIVAFLMPGTSLIEGATDSVRVTLKNFGVDTLTSLNLVYNVNGVLQATQPWAGTLLPNATTDVTFTQPFVVPAATFSICAYSSLATDAIHANDTLCMSSYGLLTSTLPYYDNFDGAISYWSPGPASAGTVWELGTPNYGLTNSAHSAPNAWDVNLTSAYTSNVTTYLYTQNFDFSTAVNAKMKFWLNYYVESGWDGVRIEYTIDTGATWNVLGVMSDPKGVNWYNDNSISSSSLPGWTGTSSGWKYSEYKLDTLDNTPLVRFRFAFDSDGSGEYDGASVDDFAITIPYPVDAGVEVIHKPVVQAPAGNLTTVKVRIKNFGMDTLYSIPVSYRIGLTGTPVTETWTGTLFPEDTATVNFATPFTMPVGAFDLYSYTSLVADGDHFNDTAKNHVTGIPTYNVPYSDNFEGPVTWVTPGTLWEWGTPSSTVINAAYSPVHAWKTNLDGEYTNSAAEYLYTPYFMFTSVDSAYLEFWHWYDTEAGYDGGIVEYSIGGGTWTTLGTQGDVNAVNWYNTASPACWSGSSSGYVYSKYRLTAIPTIVNATSPVQFRFKFFSDGSGVGDGWAVDNFAITAPPIPNDAGVVAILQPSAATQTGSQVTVQVTIKNFGTNVLTSIPVRYVVNGGAVTAETWSGSLAPLATANYTFTAPYTSPGSTYELCAFTKLTGDNYTFNDSTCASFGTTPAPNDVGVSAILSPGTVTIYGQADTVKVRIKNYGYGPVTSIPVVFTRNFVQVGAGIWNGTLNGGDSVDYTFTTLSISPIGNYTLCAKTTLTGDANTANDETCIYANGQVGIETYDFSSFVLDQNIPNPAGNNTTIVFYVPESGKVRFEMVDILGQVIRTDDIDAVRGKNQINLDAANMPEGIYFYTAEYKGEKLTKRMFVAK